MAAVILIVVIVIVGGAGYAGLNAISGSGKTTVSTCNPPTAPGCGGSNGKLNDVVVFVAFQPGIGQTMIKVNKGQTVPATVSLSGGESANSFTVNWGDGSTPVTQTSSSFTYAYQNIGVYVISATAQVGSTTHTGTGYLYPVEVVPTVADTSSGEFPTLATTFSNGSASGANYPWIAQGGSVTVSGSYSALPTAPGYTAGSPSLVSTGGTGTPTNTTTSAQGTYTFTSPGIYQITFVSPVTGPSGTIYQNYTWAVYVAATGVQVGCANCHASGIQSPHPGSLYIYEIVPGGATSLDPAVDYETTGGEVIQNVYETLIQYNGTSTASFVPVLSTCIPGPAAQGPTSCQAKYGSDLDVNGQYWTFPIDKNAQFYDPSNGAHWGVYPSDVMFSVARTLLWLQTPSQYVYNGWIIGQALLPYGQNSFDSGIHAPWNNTPQNVYASMLVNDSTYCPASIQATTNGCITFDAAGSGSLWPYFLEFIADMEGASVVPCGWFSAQGATVPGFSGTNAPNGDGPCLLPGGATSTNTTAFTNAVSHMSPTAFDSLIELGGTQVYEPQPQVRWNIVGSGPYYLVSVNQGQGYILKQNPDYAQPQCAGQTGCFPALGGYASNVYVFWDQNSVTGVEQYIAGQSDLSAFFPTDIPTILNLVQKGKIGLFTLPTLNLFPEGFSLHFDPSATQSASGQTTNVPGDFYSYVGMRQFFAQAFPYNTFINVDSSSDGIPFIQGEGGAIPQYLGNYYPQNITWPGMNTSAGQWPQVWSDPSTATGCASVVGSACWWWANITTVGSPYYDPEAVACEHSTCHLPIGSEQGTLPFDAAVDAWGAIIDKITGGAIVTSRYDPTFTQIVTDLGDPPGTNPLPTYVAGWLPDYPDPTDYMVPFYYPDGSYTYTAALNETLVGGDFGTSYNGCASHGSLSWEANSFADMAYWANYGALVPQTCQGNAYAVMQWGMYAAAALPVGPERTLYYNMVEHIASELALFAYVEQQIGLGSYSSWINPATIDTNVVAPGQLWFIWNGNNVV